MPYKKLIPIIFIIQLFVFFTLFIGFYFAITNGGAITFSLKKLEYKFFASILFIVLFFGIVLSIVMAEKIANLSSIDTAEYELEEEKKKYQQATEELVKIQKIVSI